MLPLIIAEVINAAPDIIRHAVLPAIRIAGTVFGWQVVWEDGSVTP